MATEERTRGSIQMMDDITKLLEEDGGAFGLSYRPGVEEPWMAALEWGREAEDSDMAGAAAYGLATTAGDAIEKMLREAGR